MFGMKVAGMIVAFDMAVVPGAVGVSMVPVGLGAGDVTKLGDEVFTRVFKVVPEE